MKNQYPYYVEFIAIDDIGMSTPHYIDNVYKRTLSGAIRAAAKGMIKFQRLYKVFIYVNEIQIGFMTTNMAYEVEEKGTDTFIVRLPENIRQSMIDATPGAFKKAAVTIQSVNDDLQADGQAASKTIRTGV